MAEYSTPSRRQLRRLAKLSRNQPVNWMFRWSVQEGTNVDEKKQSRFTMRMSPELDKRIDWLSYTTDRSKNSIVVEAVERYVAELEREVGLAPNTVDKAAGASAVVL